VRISAAVAAIVLVLVVVVVPQNLGAQLEPRISLSSSDHDLSGVPGGLLLSPDNVTPVNPVRNLFPAQVYPNDTFDVWVNWTLTENVSGIGLIDNTSVTNATGSRFYWDSVVSVGNGTPAPNKMVTYGGGNTSVEYDWEITIPANTSMWVHYRVTVPSNTTPGIYSMTVCPDGADDVTGWTAWLEYYVGEDAYVECINGSYQVTVLPPPSPVNRSLPPVVHCGDFDVIVNWSYPVDNRNGVGFTDLAPDIPANWTVTADPANCTPLPSFNKTTGNKIEYAWNGRYNASTDFTIRYKVTVPGNTSAGNYTFPYNDCSRSWLEYYVGEGGPYKSCTVGNDTVNVAGYNLTVNITGQGNVTINGTTPPSYPNTTTWNCGAVVNLTATPDTGYTFVNWTGNVSTIANTSAATTTITMTGDYSLLATFKSAPAGGGGGGGGAAPPPPPPPCCACDVNCDGFYNALDVSKEHRIVLLLDAPTNGSDCTRDGVVDARDVTGVKRAILWICCGPCDPNCDGSIDARDLTKMHRIIAGIDTATPGADCNGDGKVDARDLTAIKQIVVEVQAQPQPVTVPPCRCYK